MNSALTSPLRVCLTPWSVFQDGWRHPIFVANIENTRKFNHSRIRVIDFTLAQLTHSPRFCTLIDPLGLVISNRMRLPGLVLAKMKWRCVHCHCRDFRFYVTLFPKCFSNFRSRYLFAIGLPTLYLTLADIYLPIYTAFPSSATLLLSGDVILEFRGSMG